MINVGIIGGETEAAGELIRILINHPDVILRSVCSPEHAGERVDRFHRGLTGDTDLCFSTSVDMSHLNCVFLLGESWQAREFVGSLQAPAHRSEIDEDSAASHDEENLLRVIDMTGSFLHGEEGMVYGFPEYHRKAMVRGALRTSLPCAIAIALELALFPLAKNHLIGETVKANVVMPRISMANPKLSTRLDPIAPVGNRPDMGDAAREINRELKEIDPTFAGQLDLSLSTDQSRRRGLTADVTVACTANVEEVRHLFSEAYSDHGFAFVVDHLPQVNDVSNTNKSLISIDPAGQDALPSGLPSIKVSVAIDDLVKGSAGNAVHCMNLLFGLSERTGLALKASVI